MTVAFAARLAEANSVNDRGVVEFVTDDGVIFCENSLEETCVGIKARWVQDRILLPMKSRDFVFQLFVDVLYSSSKSAGIKRNKLRTFLRAMMILGINSLFLGRKANYGSSSIVTQLT